MKEDIAPKLNDKQELASDEPQDHFYGKIIGN